MIETVIWHSLLPQTVGENIRKFRKELKLSQSDLAKKCNLSSYMISKMERGKHDFRITEIEKISFGLNKKINEIIWQKQGIVFHALMFIFLIQMRINF